MGELWTGALTRDKVVPALTGPPSENSYALFFIQSERNMELGLRESLWHYVVIETSATCISESCLQKFFASDIFSYCRVCLCVHVHMCICLLLAHLKMNVFLTNAIPIFTAENEKGKWKHKRRKINSQILDYILIWFPIVFLKGIIYIILYMYIIS